MLEPAAAVFYHSGTRGCGQLGKSVNSQKGGESMATGTVKWFSADKGYGFIIPDDGGRDLFVHRGGLDGSKTTLLDGQHVEYEVAPGRKGPQAVRVRPFGGVTA